MGRLKVEYKRVRDWVWLEDEPFVENEAMGGYLQERAFLGCFGVIRGAELSMYGESVFDRDVLLNSKRSRGS
jgi:hypothetical protein